MADYSRGLWEGETPPITALPEQNLGATVRVSRDAQRYVTIIRATGSSLYSHMVTASLGVELAAFPEGVTDRRCPLLGKIKWGQGAAQFSAEVDLKEGSAIAVPATFLEVSAQFDPDEVIETPDVRPEYADVSAALIWGTRPGGLIPTRTKRITVVNGTSAVVAIPPFSRSLMVASPDSAMMAGSELNVALRFLGGPAVTDRVLLHFASSTIFPSAIVEGGICFPEGARYLEVNNTTEGPQEFSLIFNLAL